MDEKTLPPAEAARRFLADRHSVWLRLSDLVLQLGWTEEEIRREAGAGRLSLTGERFEEAGRVGYRNIRVTIGSLSDWMAHPDTPADLIEKTRRSVEPPGQGAH